MKKSMYTFGVFAFALLASGVPSAVFAESSGGEGEVNTQVGVRIPGATVTTSVTGDSEAAREGQKQSAEMAREAAKQQLEIAREQQKQQLEASSSEENLNEDQNEQGEIHLDMEDDSNPAISLEDLKQKIEVRKQELEDEEASTTPKFKNAMKNTNEVRLAVHALLASRDLLGGGGFGQQVSEIAKRMNDSVATTTNAEARIQSRGFLTRFLFGGDSASADVIAQEAAQNQSRIDSLTALLGQANISADLQVTLTAQITALKDAQARLQNLAEREQKAWGLFSWRF